MAAPFPLTDLSTVKSFAGIDKTTRDTEINLLIPAVSDAIARYLNRHDAIELRERTETFDVERGQRVWQLNAVPVSASPAIDFRFDINREFGSTTQIAAEDIHVDAESGMVRLDYTLHWYAGQQLGYGWPEIERGYGWVQITYTGGYATTLQGLRSVAPQLEMAALYTIHAMVKRKTTGPEKYSVQGQAGNTSKPHLELPEIAKQLLEPFRIWNVGG